LGEAVLFARRNGPEGWLAGAGVALILYNLADKIVYALAA
jgi:hypothetical protein